MQTVAFCEIDPYCRQVLAKHWPDVPIYEDVKTLETDRLGRIDLVCGGYPCQPFSNAGNRRGAQDDRHLWPEMHRIVDELRPAWVFGENVAGHVTLGLDDVLSDLEASGYTARAFVVPACAVDAPHRRDRVWVVAHCDSGRPAQPEGGRSKQRGWAVDRREAKPLADTGGRGQPRPWKSLDASHSAASEEGQTTEPFNGGLGCQWAIEPDVGRVAYGVPSRVDRLRALGNAVVPQIPEIIGRAIMEAGHG